MALIHCPECEHETSDQAKACPNCGHPIADTGIKRNRKKISKKSIFILGTVLVLIVAGICTLVFGKTLFFSPEEKYALEATSTLKSSLLYPDSLVLREIKVKILTKEDKEKRASEYEKSKKSIAADIDKGRLDKNFKIFYNNPDACVYLIFSSEITKGDAYFTEYVILLGGEVETVINQEYDTADIDAEPAQVEQARMRRETIEVLNSKIDAGWVNVDESKIQNAI